MSETVGQAWSCPACGRRVPARVATCHCGTHRSQAERAAPVGAIRSRAVLSAADAGPAALWRSLPADSKLLTVAGALVIVLGLGWAVFGRRAPDAGVALLGRLDRTPPPRSAQPALPFKMPWWR